MWLLWPHKLFILKMLSVPELADNIICVDDGSIKHETLNIISCDCTDPSWSSHDFLGHKTRCVLSKFPALSTHCEFNTYITNSYDLEAISHTSHAQIIIESSTEVKAYHACNELISQFICTITWLFAHTPVFSASFVATKQMIAFILSTCLHLQSGSTKGEVM